MIFEYQDCKLHISKGNTKLGRTMNVSLPPILTCPENPPCASQCYAAKFYKMRGRVREAWNDNLDFYKMNKIPYFHFINKALTYMRPKYFRWHVSGDVPDAYYAGRVQWMAYNNENTHFLIYTRTRFFDDLDIPNNLSVIESQWLGFDRPHASQFPVFMVVKPGLVIHGIDSETQVFECPGHCPECRLCWNVRPNVIITHNLH